MKKGCVTTGGNAAFFIFHSYPFKTLKTNGIFDLYQSSRRSFLGMNILSPCFTPNASYQASM